MVYNFKKLDLLYIYKIRSWLRTTNVQHKTHTPYTSKAPIWFLPVEDHYFVQV